MTLNKIYENIKSIRLWEYMIFLQDDRNLLFYSRLYPSIVESEKMSQELLTPLMTPPQLSRLKSLNWHFPQLI